MAFNIDKSSGVGPATINIQPSEYNTTGRDINQTIYVEIGGKRQPISLIQRAAVLSWKYIFTIEPTSTSIDPGGGSVSLSIKSIKQQLINGNPSGEEIPLNYTAIHYSGNSFVSIDGTTLRAEANNNSSDRIETIRFTQAESGEVQDIVIEQAANFHYEFRWKPSVFLKDTLYYGSEAINFEELVDSNKVYGDGRKEFVDFSIEVSDTSKASVSGKSVSIQWSNLEAWEGGPSTCNANLSINLRQNDTGSTLNQSVKLKGAKYFNREFLRDLFNELGSTYKQEGSKTGLIYPTSSGNFCIETNGKISYAMASQPVLPGRPPASGDIKALTSFKIDIQADSDYDLDTDSRINFRNVINSMAITYTNEFGETSSEVTAGERLQMNTNAFSFIPGSWNFNGYADLTMVYHGNMGISFRFSSLGF